MQGKAELRALAKKTLRGSARSELLEGGYHRYAFHDTNMPKWFQEDERRHMRCACTLSLTAELCEDCLGKDRCCEGSACSIL